MSLDEVTDAAFKPRRRWYEDPRPIVYVVLDVKTDGGHVRRNALRSIAASAMNSAGQELARFDVNLSPPDGSVAEPGMLQRYRKHGDAWQAITANPQRPADAMEALIGWVKALPGQPVAVGCPLAPTALWLDTYLRRHTSHIFHRGQSEGMPLFAGAGIDLPSLVMGVTGLDYRRAVEHLLPADWRGGRVETHKPREDVQMHAALLTTMLAIRAGRGSN